MRPRRVFNHQQDFKCLIIDLIKEMIEISQKNNNTSGKITSKLRNICKALESKDVNKCFEGKKFKNDRDFET